MRLLLALTLALLCLTPAEAASLANTTQHSFILGHGQVIEYLAADGSTLLRASFDIIHHTLCPPFPSSANGVKL